MEGVEMIWRQETYLLDPYLQRFLIRACLGAAADMGRFEMNWEGCSMVCDMFHSAEVGVLWPAELISSTGTKLLGCHGMFGGTALAKLKPGLGDSVSLRREAVSSSHVEAVCVLICANLAMKGFAVSQAVKAW